MVVGKADRWPASRLGGLLYDINMETIDMHTCAVRKGRSMAFFGAGSSASPRSALSRERDSSSASTSVGFSFNDASSAFSAYKDQVQVDTQVMVEMRVERNFGTLQWCRAAP